MDLYRRALIPVTSESRHLVKTLDELGPESCEAIGTLCGDRVVASVEFNDGRIADVKVWSSGCAVTTGMAEIMGRIALGQTADDVQMMVEGIEILIGKTGFEGDWRRLTIWDLIYPKSAHEMKILPEFACLAHVAGRQTCALLPWEALLGAIEGEERKEIDT